MVLIDACRNNPFLGQIRVADSGRSLGRGLSPFEPAGGTLVAFAAKGGTVALDGNGRNSPFMKGLLAHVEEPGLDVSLLFRRCATPCSPRPTTARSPSPTARSPAARSTSCRRSRLPQ